LAEGRRGPQHVLVRGPIERDGNEAVEDRSATVVAMD
jgi:hypothetical protein